MMGAMLADDQKLTAAREQQSAAEVERLYGAQDFEKYDLIRELIDECIDIPLNYRQSGHPGGSRSKVHMLVSLMLSGAMRWDLRRPWLRFGDRFVLGAGHTVPLIYSTLAVMNETLRVRHEQTGEKKYAFPMEGQFALTWESLLGLRRWHGLPGHAEMEGRTLFLKYNTGPSGHGVAPAVGEALALKRAGAEEVKVFVFEGEGGLTPGGVHEAKNTGWGLGLSNLVFMIDWNDYGIDPRPASSVVHGTPVDWFAPYGWRVTGTEEGMEWPSVSRTVLEAACGENPDHTPTMAWFKTRKGRGYGKYDYKSHGTPWPLNSAEFWALRKEFMERHGVEYVGVDEPAPADPADLKAQEEANLRIAMSVLRQHADVAAWVADRLVAVADSVPETIGSFRLGRSRAGVFTEPQIFEPERYPAEMWKKPGDKVPNRAALAAWGAYVNSLANKEYGRPLVIASSADLADSTNIGGFGAGFTVGSGDDAEEMEGWGWYERDTNPTGALLPTEITEFGNAGLVTGLASVNMAEDPFTDFDGFWGACSTYGAFSYLKYGPMRLYSQLAQDCELRVGRIIWVAGHSGPETADDSRTHFGVFAPGVTQLFPDGHVMDLHPWEYNEVPVVLAAALSSPAPIVALHLTRPAIEIPDRAALGMPSHFAAARGAYVLRPYRHDLPKGGCVFVRGTTPTANLVKALGDLDRLGLNVKVVAAVSRPLFDLQDEKYRESVVSPEDTIDAMVITNGAFGLMRHWTGGALVRQYSLSSDWDDRWRTGGTVDEVVAEAHLDREHIVASIERFVAEREARLREWRRLLDAAEREVVG
jgi:transketolase